MTSPLTSRQTLSFLLHRFRETGIRPQTRFGQNFLIDLNLLEVLLEGAAITRNDVVLEVGTGTGSLTVRLAERAAAVVTVEVDPKMFQLAGEELHRVNNVVMLHVDALKNKNRLNPTVLETVRTQLAAAPGRRFKLVANLPYNIATPIVSNLLTEDAPPQTMTVTIQKELAERITARPGSEHYGALSIWVQAQCRAEILRILPPAAFWPRPKVSSAFLQLTLDEALRGRIADRAFFHEFVPRDVLPSPQIPPLGTPQRREGPAGQTPGRCDPGPVEPSRHLAGRVARRGADVALCDAVRGQPRPRSRSYDPAAGGDD